uniref:Dehydrogenase with different specificities n=1 Tax=Ganoderma boninense TaxID=34458 RepID=A0A5K1K806_9APHY|nr:Dehydrogenase with different specificities [Ganoderma boninense]
MTSNQPLVPPAIEALVADELPKTFGAWLICASVGCMLFGLTTHQTYRYFRLYPEDGPKLKLLVFALLILDTLHTVTNIHLCYYYLVINYLNPTALGVGVWSLRALVMLVSHAFFLRRIFLRMRPVGERQIVPVLAIGILMLSELAFAIAVTVMTFVLVSFAAFKSHMWMIWVMLANAVVIDLLVTSCLIFYLWRSRTGFKRTDNLLDVLMVYTINTGLSTSLLTLPAMICAIIMPDNLIWSAIYVIASKMYANSLLAVLNSRRSLIDKGMEGFETGSFGLQIVDPRELRPLDFKTPLHHSPAPPPMSAAGVNTPSNLKVSTGSGGATSADSSSVADTVIDIKVTTETFVDIPASHHGHGHARGRDENGAARLPDDDRSDDRDSL